MQRQVEKARIVLEYQGQQIERQIHEMDEAYQVVDDSWSDHALRQHQRMRLSEKLQRISFAKQRITEGRYGQCLVCGMPIDTERLNILPETTTCVHCTEKTVRQHFQKMRQTRRCRTSQ